MSETERARTGRELTNELYNVTGFVLKKNTVLLRHGNIIQQ